MKNKAKTQRPFKCYIYCTLAKNFKKFSDYGYTSDDLLWEQSGKIARGDGFNFLASCVSDYKCLNGTVVGEFVCDKIYTIRSHENGFCVASEDFTFANKIAKESCLSFENLKEYAGKKEVLYAWHISDLKIYDNPKEIPDFTIKRKCTWCKDFGYVLSSCAYNKDCVIPNALNNPTQSYCYVEEL